jgi:hypothetical protein
MLTIFLSTASALDMGKSFRRLEGAESGRGSMVNALELQHTIFLALDLTPSTHVHTVHTYITFAARDT